ncbi:MAG: hypothetical protein Q7T54_04895 [Candidatus Levybacteria bacterium]|nr:hypothetical protein [Candidatus Levybacteria bacterium]
METEYSFIPIGDFERTLKTKDVAALTGLTESGIQQAAAYGKLPNEKRVHKNRVTRFYSPTDVAYFQIKRERRIENLMNSKIALPLMGEGYSQNFFRTTLF